MKHKIYTLVVGLIGLFLGSAVAHAADKPPADGGNVVQTAPPTTPAEQARLDWFVKARYGMFIHWGLYSELGGDWQGKPVLHGGEWIMHFGKIPVEQYEKTAAQFDPVKFDADAWAKLAKDAGMKYVVITAKHHEGFAMFDSKASPYNIVDATPFKRDVVKEMSQACAKYGLRFGVYYSQALDWHEPNGMGNDWNGWPKESDRDFDKFLTGKVATQVNELLTHYGPISLVWFDMPMNMTGERAERLAKEVRSLQPDCLINSRIGGGDSPTPSWDYLEQRDGRYPAETVTTQPWETAACINHTWGYKKDDTSFKTPASLTFELVDIVSHGGNFLLNVGPDGTGVIPQPEVDCLLTIGKWLRTNSESVYGAGPTPFGGGEFGAYSATQKNSHGGPRYFISQDWRCTSKPGRLYIHLFKWPGASFTLPACQERIARAYLLADPAHKPLACTLAGGQYHITLPSSAPDSVDSVLCLETDKS